MNAIKCTVWESPPTYMAYMNLAHKFPGALFTDSEMLCVPGLHATSKS